MRNALQKVNTVLKEYRVGEEITFHKTKLDFSRFTCETTFFFLMIINISNDWLLEIIGHLNNDVILLLQPESFSLLFSYLNLVASLFIFKFGSPSED